MRLRPYHGIVRGAIQNTRGQSANTKSARTDSTQYKASRNCVYIYIYVKYTSHAKPISRHQCERVWGCFQSRGDESVCGATSAVSLSIMSAVLRYVSVYSERVFFYLDPCSSECRSPHRMSLFGPAKFWSLQVSQLIVRFYSHAILLTFLKAVAWHCILIKFRRMALCIVFISFDK